MTGSTIVTGGASGIGAAVVCGLLERYPGAACAVLDVAVDELPQRLTAQVGSERLRLFACDVTDPEAIEAAIGAVETASGPVRSLVNAAGIWSTAPTLDLPYDDWRRTLAVNLDGTLIASQCVARRMLTTGGGAIVNLSSVSGYYGCPERAAYGASKAAINSLTQTLAVEWAPHGIRVNAVAPGYIDTPMLRAVLGSDRLGDAGPALPSRRTALERIGAAREVAEVVLFLLSDAASYVTGEVIRVDGGYSAIGH
jgi:NAD(P)-dependent dehydrogenase (short-subunit alcohol dehydrogenase family)